MPIGCGMGVWRYMPKTDKNDASNGLILDHEVLQNFSNFFQVDFGHGLDSKI